MNNKLINNVRTLLNPAAKEIIMAGKVREALYNYIKTVVVQGDIPENVEILEESMSSHLSPKRVRFVKTVELNPNQFLLIGSSIDAFGNVRAEVRVGQYNPVRDKEDKSKVDANHEPSHQPAPGFSYYRESTPKPEWITLPEKEGFTVSIRLLKDIVPVYPAQRDRYSNPQSIPSQPVVEYLTPARELFQIMEEGKVMYEIFHSADGIGHFSFVLIPV